MEGLNKIISFVLGLVVVIVFFAVVTGKLDLKNKLTKTTKTQTSASTVTLEVSPTPKEKNIANTNTYGSYKSNNKTTSIPSTGIPTLFVPTLLAAAFGGFSLKNIGKKN